MKQQRQISREEVREEARYNRIFCGHFFLPGEFSSRNATSHYQANELLNSNKTHIAIMCHRYWAKSTFLSYLAPLHKVCYNEPRNTEFIVIISESQAQSVSHLRRIKFALQFNRKIKSVFGDFYTGAPKWGETEIITNNGVRITAMGCGQKVRSLIHIGGKRPTLTILDDIESEKNAGSPELRRKNFDWLYAAVLPFRHKEGRIIFTQSPISNDCAIYRVMDDPTWATIKMPLYDEIDGEIVSNWPEEWPVERILEEKRRYASQNRLGLFMQEYQLVPYKGEMVGITEDDIRWWDGELVTDDLGVTFIRNFVETDFEGKPISDKVNLVVNSFAGCDPAVGEERQHDYTADQIILRDFNDNYILGQDMIYRLSSTYQIGRDFGEFAYSNGAIGLGVETIAFQQAVGEALLGWCSENGVEFDAVRGFKPRTKKDIRLNWWINKFKAGKVFMRRGRDELKKQHLDWPNGAHDDALDACYMAAKISYPPGEQDITVLHEMKERANYGEYYDNIPSARCT